MGALPRTLEIIFEVQRKKSNEKIKRKKTSFSIYKTHFILFFLGPLLLSNLVTLLFPFHFKRFKMV
jgi:hypothetical protein